MNAYEVEHEDRVDPRMESAVSTNERDGDKHVCHDIYIRPTPLRAHELETKRESLAVYQHGFSAIYRLTAIQPSFRIFSVVRLYCVLAVENRSFLSRRHAKYRMPRRVIWQFERKLDWRHSR
ncbi:hypothetical protein AXF42_Ash010589 [Apostasia shenzhenica]|uniref:Uncharacterized protein n=1 Tax=Apostasia shenzhenica TaxID=1088818 RepID=A0A2I0A6I0_9ASPA|nr:hypothetical protein AXF42_Ash010589 [Apostasia shenzhenica]